MLRLTEVVAGYGAIEALHGVSLDVPAGQIVALLGANGAGKSTTLLTVAGLLSARKGAVEFDGSRIDGLPSHRIYARGIALVPQGRELFPEMTVAENLELGFRVGTKQEREQRLEEMYSRFPRLRERWKQRAGTLSGGERAMLAAARGLMSRPALLLLDEPTAGLAPLIVKQFAEILVGLNRSGQTILLVEQNIRMALAIAHHVYVIRNGQIVLESDAKDVANDEALFRSYLG